MVLEEEVKNFHSTRFKNARGSYNREKALIDDLAHKGLSISYRGLREIQDSISTVVSQLEP